MASELDQIEQKWLEQLRADRWNDSLWLSYQQWLREEGMDDKVHFIGEIVDQTTGRAVESFHESRTSVASDWLAMLEEPSLLLNS